MDRPVVYQNARPEEWEPTNGDGRCTKCTAWWFSFNSCHCKKCHLTFIDELAFDYHKNEEHCCYPKDVGLHFYPSGMWGESPITNEGLLQMFV